MAHPGPDLAGHPDRLRWNAKYKEGSAASFAAHPLAARALSVPPPAGPVLDLASGPSGSALLAAATGRRVTAVDVSDTALALLAAQASRLQLAGRIWLIHADLTVWRPPPASYTLVLCTGYWDRHLFPAAARAVAAGGVLGWEAFTVQARHTRPGLPVEWCLGPGEPASLLPPGFEILSQHDLPGAKRRLLARRTAAAPL